MLLQQQINLQTRIIAAPMVKATEEKIIKAPSFT